MRGRCNANEWIAGQIIRGTGSEPAPSTGPKNLSDALQVRALAVRRWWSETGRRHGTPEEVEHPRRILVAAISHRYERSCCLGDFVIPPDIRGRVPSSTWAVPAHQRLYKARKK
jgi:hypothetical protein